VTAMAGRLRHAEQAAAELREEIKKRDATIQQLRVELSKQMRGNAAGAGLDEPSGGAGAAAGGGGGGKGPQPNPLQGDAAALADSNRKLKEMLRRADAESKEAQRENAQMKKFLKDYGMTWVGDDSGSSSGGSGSEPSSSRGNSASPGGSPLKVQDVAGGDGAKAPEKRSGKDLLINGGDWVVPGTENGVGDLNSKAGVESLGTPFDPAQIMTNAKKLNHIAGEGQKEVVAGADGIRRLKEKCVVSYIFYSDGIWARGGPLRPYSVRESKVLVRDLMDGYFPWELKDDYPEGVPLRIEMRLDEAKSGGGAPGGGGPAEQFTAFKGAGVALGKEEGGLHAKVEGVSEAARREVWAPSVGNSKGETLFRQLPDKVVKNGNVIDVKGDIQKMLGIKEGPSQGAGAAQGQAPGGGVRVEKVEGKGGEGGAGELAILRIKCPGGERVLEVHLPYDAKVGDIHSSVQAHLGSGIKHKIRSSFPAREYGDDAVTLLEAGLTPNALLFLTES
jgi:hypothetical protein